MDPYPLYPLVCQPGETPGCGRLQFPAGDTVIDRPEFQSLHPYYDVIREVGRGNVDSGRQIVLSDPDQYPLITRPVDKEENYIKRCVSIAGDTLQIKNQVVYINGVAQPFPPESETDYTVTTKGQPLDEGAMKDEYDVDINSDDVRPIGPPNEYNMLLTWKAKEKMEKSGLALSIVPNIDSERNVYPYSDSYPWSRDNYGPLWIPPKALR